MIRNTNIVIITIKRTTSGEHLRLGREVVSMTDFEQMRSTRADLNLYTMVTVRHRVVIFDYDSLIVHDAVVLF